MFLLLIGLYIYLYQILPIYILIKAKDAIIAREPELQELNSKAAGEIVVKEALDELDVWEVEAKFSFLDHQEYFIIIQSSYIFETIISTVIKILRYLHNLTTIFILSNPYNYIEWDNCILSFMIFLQISLLFKKKCLNI